MLVMGRRIVFGVFPVVHNRPYGGVKFLSGGFVLAVQTTLPRVGSPLTEYFHQSSTSLTYTTGSSRCPVFHI